MFRLKEEGYRVTWFADPQDMDEQGNSDAPDLLLLDVQLPGETGYSIAKRYPHEARIVLSLSHTHTHTHTRG